MLWKQVLFASEELDTMWGLIQDGHGLRFAKKGKSIPNVELRIINNKYAEMALKQKIKVLLGAETLYVSPIELQIAFKREVLKSKKDFEDALHLEIVFKNHLNQELLTGLENELKANY